jgi:hypothetical protein
MATATVLQLDDVPGTGHPRWRGGGDRHEASWNDRGADRAAGPVRAVVTASPALSRGPKWTFLNFGTHFTEPAVLCGFKIKGTQLVDKAYIKTLKTTAGSTTFLLNGSARIALTNSANGKTITQNVSGPVKLIANADGSTIYLGKGIGPFGLAPADQARFKLPGLFIFAGAGGNDRPGRDHHHLADPAWPHGGQRVRGIELAVVPLPSLAVSLAQAEASIGRLHMTDSRRQETR